MLPSLSRSWTVAAGSAFFGCLKLRGLGDKFICVESVLCVVHASQKKACWCTTFKCI